MVSYCLVCLEKVCQEVLLGFPPGHQRVNQVLDIGIELGDVASNCEDVGIQCTELGSDVPLVSMWASQMRILRNATPLRFCLMW